MLQVRKRIVWVNKVLDSHEVDSVTLVYFKNELDKKDRKVNLLTSVCVCDCVPGDL